MLRKLRNYISKKTDNISKSECLIYVIITLWVVFGAIGIYTKSNLMQIAGYYTSLTLFISTYLWGEHTRGSTSTGVMKKGKSSSREIVIYITVLLWTILGVYGIFKMDDINPLTVYFSSLSPFVISYIIYKTNKGADLPIFNKKQQDLINQATDSVDISEKKKKKEKEDSEDESAE